jgi:hypothetical protein
MKKDRGVKIMKVLLRRSAKEAENNNMAAAQND